MMAQLLEDSSFCEEFIQQCPAAVEVLNLVAQECSPGEHIQICHQDMSATVCLTHFCHLVQESALAWLKLNVRE